MSEIQYIGITEAGDPAFNLDIFDKLYDNLLFDQFVKYDIQLVGFQLVAKKLN